MTTTGRVACALMVASLVAAVIVAAWWSTRQPADPAGVPSPTRTPAVATVSALTPSVRPTAVWQDLNAGLPGYAFVTGTVLGLAAQSEQATLPPRP